MMESDKKEKILKKEESSKESAERNMLCAANRALIEGFNT